MFDLTKYFDGICISSDEECSKPDEKYFKTLFDRYGLEKSESIMIGNDYISDIGGAADFGIDSLYIHQSISPEIDGELRSIQGYGRRCVQNQETYCEVIKTNCT